MNSRRESAQPGSKGAFKTTFDSNYSTKRYPPYGKKLDNLRRRGLVPKLRVVIATDWKIGKLFPRVVITPDQDVHNLRFEYLCGLHVQIAFFEDDHHIDRLINEVISVRPATLQTFNFDAIKGERAAKLIYSDAEMGVV